MLLAALLAGACSMSCRRSFWLQPLCRGRLDPRVGKCERDAGIDARGAAVRLGDDSWRLTVVLDGVAQGSVEGMALLGEAYPLSLSEEDGRCAVAWEVPADRWKAARPFRVSLRLRGRGDELRVVVRHPVATEGPTRAGRILAGIASIHLRP